MAVEGISKTVANALGKTALQRGLTVDAYLKQLIAEDVELDRVARTKTFAELAIPFQKALAHLSDGDLDAIARSRSPNTKTSRGKMKGKKRR